MFTEDDVIYAYTRKQAVEDGFIVEFDSKLVKEAGFPCQVDMTRTVFDIIEPNELERSDGQDIVGRQWDVLGLLRLRVNGWRKACEASGEKPEIPVYLRFETIFWMKRPEHRNNRRGHVTVQFKAALGADFDGTPTITVMLPNED